MLSYSVKHLLRSSGTTGRISFNVSEANNTLDLERAIPCGLILNELFTNAIKHAFPSDKQGGHIEISLSKTSEDNFELVVRDNGVGLPLGFDILKSSTLGLQLVAGLCSQLSGNIAITSTEGTCFRISFPVRKETKNGY